MGQGAGGPRSAGGPGEPGAHSTDDEVEHGDPVSDARGGTKPDRRDRRGGHRPRDGARLVTAEPDDGAVLGPCAPRERGPHSCHGNDELHEHVHRRRRGLSCRLGGGSTRPGEGADGLREGQPCLRSSPLAKRYGWGFHYDAEGRVALVPVGSPEYEAFVTDDSLTVVKAMRSKRK